MILNEIQLQKNIEIVEALIKWRSMTLDSLKTVSNINDSSGAFRKRILRMENGGLLKAKVQRGCNKIIYPSRELLHRFGIESFSEETVRHDSIVSMLGISLKNFSMVKSIKLPHEFQTKASWKHHPIVPDAIIEIEKGNSLIRAALEVELWRKDRKRVFEKILDYAKAYEYDNVFYFFADRPSFDSYQKRIFEMLNDSRFSHLKEELEKKFVLVFNGNLAKKVAQLEHSEIYHDLKTKKLGDLIL